MVPMNGVPMSVVSSKTITNKKEQIKIKSTYLVCRPWEYHLGKIDYLRWIEE